MLAEAKSYVPRTCPVVDGRKYRYSVGYQEGEVREIIAWFQSIQQAAEYAKSMNMQDMFRPDDPSKFHYNVIASLE